VTPDAEDGKEVLGSLPRRRPNIESPRRASARAAAQKARTESAAETPREASRSELAEVEQLAQAGAKLAAGAAAAGLKLAGRAVGGLGRVVGR
jgi:formate-dependent nitrite reductase cytochrome c552 subunit